MKSSIKKLPQSIVELTIEETAENIAKHRKKALATLRKNADIKGFRKGTEIPEAILIKQYGEERIFSLCIDEALQTLYTNALKEHSILPVAQWEIYEIKSQSPLCIVMHVETFPEITIDKKYKDIKLKKTQITVSDEEVDGALSDIQKRFTKFEAAPEGYEAKMGDKVVIDTQGYNTKGETLPNTDMKAYPIVLGSHILVPGFEEGLVGKKAWEDVSLDVTFPKDYHNKDFAGKKTKFEVKIHSIESALAPEFTKEFIQQLRGKDLDLNGFRDLIKQELLETKENNARMQEENALIDELLKVSSVDFGKHMLQNQVKSVYAEIKENITASGAKVADYIASLGMTEEDYIKVNVEPIAIKRLQAELILHKLGELEKTTVSDKEIETEVEKILSRFESKDVVSRLKELYIPGNRYYEELKQRIVYRKLIDSFFA